MIQKLTRIKNIGPSARDPFGDYGKLVMEVVRIKPRTAQEAAVLAPSEVKYFLRSSHQADDSLPDKPLDDNQLLSVLKDAIGFDNEWITEIEDPL